MTAPALAPQVSWSWDSPANELQICGSYGEVRVCVRLHQIQALQLVADLQGWLREPLVRTTGPHQLRHQAFEWMSEAHRLRAEVQQLQAEVARLQALTTSQAPAVATAESAATPALAFNHPPENLREEVERAVAEGTLSSESAEAILAVFYRLGRPAPEGTGELAQGSGEAGLDAGDGGDGNAGPSGEQPETP